MVLILSGILIGVLAARFLPLSSLPIIVPPASTPTTYDECLQDPGSVVQESYPATCVTAAGVHFIQPIPTASASADLTANWKKYIFTDKLSQKTYEIKYPEDWSALTGPREIGSGFSIAETNLKYDISFTFSANSKGSVCIFSDDPRFNSTKSGIIKAPNCPKEYAEIIGEQFTFRRQDIFDTKISTIWTVFLKNPPGDFTNEPLIQYTIPKNYDSSIVEIMDQILSTFKFTDISMQTNQSCGGVTNTKCPSGYVCQTTAMYPNAGGTCTPITTTP